MPFITSLYLTPFLHPFGTALYFSCGFLLKSRGQNKTFWHIFLYKKNVIKWTIKWCLFNICEYNFPLKYKFHGKPEKVYGETWLMSRFRHTNIMSIRTVKICFDKFLPIPGTHGHWEMRGFLSVLHLLWHGACIYNGNLRGPVTLTPIVERFSVELSPPHFTT